MQEYAEQFATRKDYIAMYRFGHAFNPVHGILLYIHPLKRLWHVSQVFIAGTWDPQLVKHLGFVWAKSVEEVVDKAQLIYRKDAVVACVQYP